MLVFGGVVVLGIVIIIGMIDIMIMMTTVCHGNRMVPDALMHPRGRRKQRIDAEHQQRNKTGN